MQIKKAELTKRDFTIAQHENNRKIAVWENK